MHQGKYTKDVLRKFDMGEAKTLSMPMSTMMALDVDEEGEAVDQKEYQSMIGSLLYLTATRSNIQFVVYLCAHFQSSLCTSHCQAVKRILRYLCFTPKFGLWFLASSSLSLCKYSDADYARCHVERKSTLETYQFLCIFSCVLVFSQAV